MVARLLALRHGLTAYHYDYHDARGHNGRRAAWRFRLGDPERAQRNRLARDRLVADDAECSAHRHGICVITVDGAPRRTT